MPSDDDRAAFAKAYSRVSFVFSIALEMVVPGALGYWLDHYLGTKLVFAVVGFAFGLTYGIWQLVRMGQREQSNLPHRRWTHRPDTTDTGPNPTSVDRAGAHEVQTPGGND